MRIRNLLAQITTNILGPSVRLFVSLPHGLVSIQISSPRGHLVVLVTLYYSTEIPALFVFHTSFIQTRKFYSRRDISQPAAAALASHATAEGHLLKFKYSFRSSSSSSLPRVDDHQIQPERCGNVFYIFRNEAVPIILAPEFLDRFHKRRDSV